MPVTYFDCRECETKTPHHMGRHCGFCNTHFCQPCFGTLVKIHGHYSDEYGEITICLKKCDHCWQEHLKNLHAVRDHTGTGSLELTVAYAVIEKAITEKNRVKPPDPEPDKRKAEAVVEGEPDAKRQKVEAQ